MERQTQVGITLLVPPVLSWLLLILVVNDDPVGLYIAGRLSPIVLDIIYLVGGLIFPSSALVVAINGLVKKQDKRFNISVVVLAALFFLATLIPVFI